VNKEQLMIENSAARTIEDLIRVVLLTIEAYHTHEINLREISDRCRAAYIRCSPGILPGKKYVNGRPWTVLQIAHFLNRTTTGGRGRKVKPDKNVTIAVNLLDLLARETPPEEVLQMARLNKGTALKLSWMLKKNAA
jgi:hypothetical protein